MNFFSYRSNAVEGDTRGRPLHRQRLGQTFDASASSSAVRQAWAALIQHDDDVDDAAAVLLHVGVVNLLRHQEGAVSTVR